LGESPNSGASGISWTVLAMAAGEAWIGKSALLLETAGILGNVA
jgi:hypothetical protein